VLSPLGYMLSSSRMLQKRGMHMWHVIHGSKEEGLGECGQAAAAGRRLT
jgi:hypothetical protein